MMMMTMMIVVIVMVTTKKRKQPTADGKRRRRQVGMWRSSDGKQKMSVARKSKAENPYETNQRANTSQGERRTL
jgi:hypothetical protein